MIFSLGTDKRGERKAEVGRMSDPVGLAESAAERSERDALLLDSAVRSIGAVCHGPG